MRPAPSPRLLELGLPSYLIRATLIGVMAQRLARTLCEDCKESTQLEEEVWRDLTRPWKAPLPEKTCRPVGCLNCRNTGYLGRTGAYEIMPVDGALKDQITEDCNVTEIRREAYRQGMMSLRLSGAQKVAAGLTTVEEVMRVTPKASALTRAILNPRMARAFLLAVNQHQHGRIRLATRITKTSRDVGDCESHSCTACHSSRPPGCPL